MIAILLTPLIRTILFLAGTAIIIYLLFGYWSSPFHAVNNANIQTCCLGYCNQQEERLLINADLGASFRRLQAFVYTSTRGARTGALEAPHG